MININPYRFALGGQTPSLDLQFANLKNLNNITTGTSPVTFTRASSGTFVGSNGLIQSAATNVPRFDHTPTTGVSLGLLVEEQRANQLLWSEEANNPAWNIPSSSVLVNANVAVAPDGATTADKVVEATNTGGHSIEVSGFAFQSGVTYTVSFYAKAVERRRFRLTFPTVFTNRLVFVDINPASYGVISSGGTVTQVIPAGNDWFRVVSTSTCTTTTAGARIGITFVDTGTNVSYTGDGFSGLLIWGAQLEAGAFPTSYIPTTTATVTRAADVASITGTNFSSWYNQTEGTVFCQFVDSVGTGTENPFSVNDNTLNNRFNLFVTSNNTLSLRLVVGGVATNPNNLTVVPTTQIRAAIAAKTGTNECNGAANGNLSSASSPTSMPNVNQLNIGSRNGALEPLNGTIARLTYWPVRLPNAVLQQITS